MKQQAFSKQKLFLNRERQSEKENQVAAKQSSLLKSRAHDGPNRAWGNKSKFGRYSSIEKRNTLQDIDSCPLNINAMVRCKSIFNIRKTLQKDRITTQGPEVSNFTNSITQPNYDKSNGELKAEEKESENIKFYERKLKKSQTISFPKKGSHLQNLSYVKILPIAPLVTEEDEEIKESAQVTAYSSLSDRLFITKRSKMEISQHQSIVCLPYKQKSLLIESSMSFSYKNELKDSDKIELSQRFRETSRKIQEAEIKLSKLDMKIGQKEQIISSLTDKQQNLAIQIKENESLLEELTKKIEQDTIFMEVVTKESKDMKMFIEAQSNRILQTEAKGYKQKEEQLFEMACLLQQTNLVNLSSWISESTLIPRSSFMQTLKALTVDSQANFDHKHLKEIKRSLLASHQHIVQILSTRLDSQCAKIKEFTETMRRLASYTIGKREFLDETNGKMIVASSLATQTIQKLREKLHLEKNLDETTVESKDNTWEVCSLLDKIDGLCAQMRRIYNKAQVFY